MADTACCWACGAKSEVALTELDAVYSVVHALDAGSTRGMYESLILPSRTVCQSMFVNEKSDAKRYGEYKKWAPPRSNYSNITCGACVHNLKTGAVAYHG